MDMENGKRYIDIKKYNRARIFKTLMEKGSLSRQEILLELKLSMPTVTQNMMELEERGLIEESGFIGNTGGRRAKTYRVKADARTAIGLYITRNHISVVAVNLLGEAIYKKREWFAFEISDAYAKKIAELVDNTITEAGLEPEKVLGVGIGLPGLVSSDHLSVTYGKTMNFTGASCEDFAKYIPFSCRLYHDVDAACFAEAWTNQDMKNAFYLLVSNSVGGAVHVNYQLYGGENIRAGEIGHVNLVPNGRLCYCGKRGCVDAYCNISLLSKTSLTDFFIRLKRKEPEACSAWQEYVNYLAVTCNNLRMLFDCKVIIGGYLGEFIDDHLEEIRAVAATLSPFENSGEYIISCQYKNEAVGTGAALYYIKHFIENI